MTDDSLWTDGGKDTLLDGGEAARSTKPRRLQLRGHIGCPLAWFRRAYPVARSKGDLAVWLWLWRLRASHRLGEAPRRYELGRRLTHAAYGWRI